MKIDSHQHFWVYNANDFGWISDDMAEIRRDFLPREVKPLLASNGFDGCIAVQVRHTLADTEFLLKLAEKNAFIKGVIAWVDLRSAQVEHYLERYMRHAKFKGIRHLVHDEPDDDFVLRPEFQRGVRALQRFNLSYDLLLKPRHLRNAARLVQRFPDVQFVLDHLGKPLIRDKQLSPWREDIGELAKLPNVMCKLSGLVTEADWHHWTPDDLRPYIDVVMAAFGPDRVMIGSDWPVCTLAGDYSTVIKIVTDYIQQLTPDAQANILGETCQRAYHLED